MSTPRARVWEQLPEDFREQLAEAARRARDASPGHREGLRTGAECLPHCEESVTPYGPLLERSLTLRLGESGLEAVFEKISRLEALLARGGLEGSPLEAIGDGGLDRVLFLDLETTGFSSTPLFLAGTLAVGSGSLHVRQLFAGDYSQERSLLHRIAEVLGGTDILITFNGKSYDLPFLKDRFCFHGLRLGPVGKHLDLLHPARRRWRRELPDCRLVTLEWHLCGRPRFGDIHGSEIPAVYHEFVRTGYAPAMKQVFHHNVLDLITLAELLCELAAGG